MLITLLYAGVKLTCNYTLKLTIRKFKVEEKVMFFFVLRLKLEPISVGMSVVYMMVFQDNLIWVKNIVVVQFH